MAWTVNQLEAINERGKNLLVAAAAGSGKTSVMVERVVSLLDSGANYDELLSVTFTRSSSADMRDKLRRRFFERASSGDARAREQLERLESAQISTLHSFCTSVLRENFEAAGVDPMFRVLDDAEDRQLIDRALDTAIENAYQKGGEAQGALDFARGPKRVRELAAAMYYFLRERPDPEEWMQYSLDLCAGDGSIWKDTLVSAAQSEIYEAIALNSRGVEIAEFADGPAHYAVSMREDGLVLDNMTDLNYENLSNACLEFKQITPKSARKKEFDPELYETVADIRKRVKKRVESARGLLSLNAEASMNDIRDNVAEVQKLYEIVQDMNEYIRAFKTRKAALTFSDLEHLTLAALKNPQVSERVKGRFAYVFVDEYQDTSDVQEAILSLVAKENNLFLVGDVKQSIYRFRNAEPKLFLNKYASYGELNGGKLIVLSQNFRSRKSVLDFTNHIFERVMHGNDSEIVYDDDAKLYAGAKFEGDDPPVELMLVDKGAVAEDDAETETDTDMSDAEREGVLIARRIRELREENASLKYSDICIITRTRAPLLPLAAALSCEGIPSYADASESYFDALEVMEVMAALRLVVNRRRDIDLISVMRSPMFGFTTSELAEIRARGGSGSYYQALRTAREGDKKLDGFLQMLDDWRTLSRSLPLSRLIRRIMSDTHFYAYVGALPGGAQRQANLDVLCAKAAAYEAANTASLPEFIEYADGMRARHDGDGAHLLGENDDVVRLMTSHKSKGLEFPVVFAAMLGRKFRPSRADDALTAHRDLGMALMRIDKGLQTRRDTIARRAIAAKYKIEARAEELRILYVTLTRAKSRLILTGTVPSLKARAPLTAIANKFPDMYSSALDIVLAAAADCPGCEELGLKAAADNPHIKLKIFPAGVAASHENDSDDGLPEALDKFRRALNGEFITREALENINWRYPHSERISAPVKLTASGLARDVIGAYSVPETVARPDFLAYGGLTPAERGTATHAVLRALDYNMLRELSESEYQNAVKTEMDSMTEKGLLTPNERTAVSERAVADFLRSPIGRRALASERVEREWRFNLRMPLKDALSEAAADAEILVQGSIDMCFIEDNEWVLIDYKTDRTDDKNALSERYAPQLKLYSKALLSITGVRVKQAILCLVSQREYIDIDIPDA